MYYGKGFNFTEVYNMPIYLRRFYIKRLQKQLEDENKSIKKAKSKSKATAPPSFRK